MSCIHLTDLESVPTRARGCEDCLRLGMVWVHLRVCLECGHVGCCDSSPGKHATQNYHHTDHPVIASLQPGERWAWCYIDGTAFDLPAKFAMQLRA